MAKATFHSFRGEKSALILLKENAFVFSATPVYVPKGAVIALLGETPEVGAELDVPDGYKLVDMVDPESGEVRTSESGATLKVLAY